MRNEEGHAAVHCSAPVNIKAPSGEGQIRSVGYDRRRDWLEIEFTPGHMMCGSPIRLRRPIYQQLLAAKPMYLFLHQILKPCGVRFQYVCTEAKRAIMMAGIACGLLGFE